MIGSRRDARGRRKDDRQREINTDSPSLIYSKGLAGDRGACMRGVRRSHRDSPRRRRSARRDRVHQVRKLGICSEAAGSSQGGGVVNSTGANGRPHNEPVFVSSRTQGVNLSGGLLTLRYRSGVAMKQANISLKPSGGASAVTGLISTDIFSHLAQTARGKRRFRCRCRPRPAWRARRRPSSPSGRIRRAVRSICRSRA